MKKLLLCLLAIIIGIFFSSNVLQSHSFTPPTGQACNSSGCHGGGGGAGISCTPSITVVSHYLGPQTNLSNINFMDPGAAIDTLTITISIPGATSGGFQLSCNYGNFKNVDTGKTIISHVGSMSYISHYKAKIGLTSWIVKWYPNSKFGVGGSSTGVTFSYSTVCDTITNQNGSGGSGGGGGSCLPSCSGTASGTFGASSIDCYCYTCTGSPRAYKKGFPSPYYYTNICFGDTIVFAWNNGPSGGGGTGPNGVGMGYWWGNVTGYASNNSIGNNITTTNSFPVVNPSWTSVNISYQYETYCQSVHIQSQVFSQSIPIVPKPQIPILGQVSICSSKGVLLGSNINVITSIPPYSAPSAYYQWTPSNNLDTSTKYRPIAKPLTPTTYTLQVRDWNGCISTATQMVNFSIPSFSNTTKTICSNQPILINHKFVNVPGVYSDTLVNHTGCDSIVTITLIVKNIGVHQLPNQTICSNSFYYFNNHKINSAGIYYDTLVNYVGCDSILSLNLIVRNTSNYSYSQAICNHQSYLFNSHQLNQGGIYYDTLQNYLGCDSIITLNLIIKPISNSSFSQTICSNQFYSFNNHNLNQTGIYFDTLQNYLGCDSIISLSLKVLLNGSTYNKGICPNQSYYFNGNNLSSAGTYYDTLQNYLGCDSFITLNLKVNQPSSKMLTQNICTGQAYNLNGTIINQNGTYYDTIQNHFGCDSFITLHLIVNPISNYSFAKTICYNDIYYFNNHLLFSSGTYYDTLINHNTCDSFITLHLTVLPTSTITNIYKTICGNNPVLFNGKLLSTTGKYYDTLQNYLGCDSVIMLRLTVKPAYQYNSTTLTICEGSIYFYNGQIYTTNTQLYDTFQTQLGCDSIIGIQIIAIPAPDTTVIQSGNKLIAQAQHSSYFWYDCTQHQLIQNANDDTFVVNHSGTYAVFIQDSITFCSDTSNCRMVVVSGIEELTTNGFSIYPNPVNNVLICKCANMLINTIEVTNVLGQIQNCSIAQYTIRNTENYQLNTENLPSGLYFIKATDTKGNIRNAKFVKE